MLALATLAALAALPPGRLLAAEGSGAIARPAELKRLSLEELLDINVSLVSRRPERLAQAASAIQVLTSEDIRRSGATNLAEALRLVPNVEVQQINAYAWVVSTRGFDALFSNKLLVMIDGRTVYSALHAGVFWDAQNVLLEDVDRIEVISGPGGTMWGANAVNGVINIVTKSAEETQGAYVSGAGGSFVRDEGAGRLGGRLGRVSYRVHAQQQDRNTTRRPDGGKGMSSWRMRNAGFRLDTRTSSISSMSVQGDAYAGTQYNSNAGRSSLDGQHLLTRWSRTSREDAALEVQLYVDRTWRRDLPSTVSDQHLIYDADVQHRFALAGRHQAMWAVGYRYAENYAPTSTPFVGLLPVRRPMRLVTSLIQDEMTLVPGRLELTVGTKFEHHEFSGAEVQPSARLTWTPSPAQALWTAVSRAVRSPSRIDVDYYIPKTPPFAINGGPDFQSETLVAYELGYRVQPARTLSLSVAGSYNHYDELYGVELQNPPAPLPYTIQNGAAGQSWGVELSGLYQPADGWRLRGGYTHFQKDLWSRPGHDVLDNVLASLGNDPEHQAVLQSMVNLGRHVEWDLVFRYVDRLPNPEVPSYVALDARLAAHFGPWELTWVAQNLTDPSHAEWDRSQEIPRSMHGKLTARW